MNYRNLTEAQAELIADAYFIYDKDRMKMGHALGLGRSMDNEYLVHPLVRRKIVSAVRQMRRDGVYSREEHIQKLQEIRDACMTAETPKYRDALAAEIAVGRAAGLYENFGPGEDDPSLLNNKPPEQLSTAEIRTRLSRVQGALPASRAVVDQPAHPSDDEAF